MNYLLDTNVLSEVIRRVPDARVLVRMARAAPESLFASVVSVMEMRFGCSRSGRGEALWKRIASRVLPRVRILGFSAADAVRAGDLLALLARGGTPISCEDLWIAATALERGLTVVTRNEKHFARVPGLRIDT